MRERLRSARTQLTRRRVIGGAALVLLGLVTAAADAQPSERVTVDIGDCVDIEAREQRLQCYEDRATEVLQAREVEHSDTQDATSSEVAQADRRESRRSERRLRSQQDAATANEAPESSGGEIVATVTALQELEPNAYLITLDNDQVWRQNRLKPNRLRVGTEVRLRPTRWGPSYRLTAPGINGYLQVERVR
jgi:hypothetical protein